MQAHNSLKKVISNLEHTFANIDVRGVAGKKNGRKEECECDEWICIFLKLRLTVDNRSKILEVHENKKGSLAFKNNDKFKLFAECRSINELNNIIEQMQDGQITIEGIPLKLITPEITNIYDKQVETFYNGYSTPKENSGYNYWFVFAILQAVAALTKLFKIYDLHPTIWI